jgi:hypothetical protein
LLVSRRMFTLADPRDKPEDDGVDANRTPKFQQTHCLTSEGR